MKDLLRRWTNIAIHTLIRYTSGTTHEGMEIGKEVYELYFLQFSKKGVSILKNTCESSNGMGEQFSVLLQFYTHTHHYHAKIVFEAKHL